MIKNIFGKAFCDICLKKCKFQHLGRLHVCSDCLEKIKSLQKEEPLELSKEQMPGGIKDEL